MKQTRQPIISVLGHVDHGKTMLLDHIRGTRVAEHEAGGITQHIGATEIPIETIRKVCGGLLEKLHLKITLRGLLFVDTPGHEAFTNLRKRGGSVADLAILVIDLNEGLMPQTIEAIQILKGHKTPFVVAANKIDKITGWRLNTPPDEQIAHVKEEFYKRFYKLVSDLSEQGFNADLYSNVRDFTKMVAIIPTSAKTGNGVPELLMVLIGLAQQYMGKQLVVSLDTPGRGVVLEVKEERGLGTTIDTIIYDGRLRKGDTLVVGAKEPIVTSARALLNPENVDEVFAASGIKIVAQGLGEALSGAPVYVVDPEFADIGYYMKTFNLDIYFLKKLEKIKSREVRKERLTEKLKEVVRKEVTGIEIVSDVSGVIIKADTIGSLEAIIKILSDHKVPIRKGTVGNVVKEDVIEADAVGTEKPLLGVIFAFNTPVSNAARELIHDKGLKIFESNIIYTLLEDYDLWVKEEKEKVKKTHLITPCKIELLPKCIFRNSGPAIVGVEVLAGVLRTGYRLMNDGGKVIGRVKEIQEKKEKIKEAKKRDQVAVSIQGGAVGRNLNEGDVLYSFISFEDAEKLIDAELDDDELEVFGEIKKIKRTK